MARLKKQCNTSEPVPVSAKKTFLRLFRVRGHCSPRSPHISMLAPAADWRGTKRNVFFAAARTRVVVAHNIEIRGPGVRRLPGRNKRGTFFSQTPDSIYYVACAWPRQTIWGFCVSELCRGLTEDFPGQARRHTPRAWRRTSPGRPDTPAGAWRETSPGKPDTPAGAWRSNCPRGLAEDIPGAGPTRSQGPGGGFAPASPTRPRGHGGGFPQAGPTPLRGLASGALPVANQLKTPLTS